MVRRFLVSNVERERVVSAPTERVAAERFQGMTGELAEVVRYGASIPTIVRGLCVACLRPILDSDPRLTLRSGSAHAECPIGRCE